MTLYSSSTNNMSPTTTDAVHEKIADTIEKESPKKLRTINIQLQPLLLMMMLNQLENQEKVITVSLHYVPKHL